MDVTNIISQILQIFYGFLVEGGQLFGAGLSSIVQNVFFVTTETGTDLSAFAIVCFITFGISLLVGLTRVITNFISGLGGGRM